MKDIEVSLNHTFHVSPIQHFTRLDSPTTSMAFVKQTLTFNRPSVLYKSAVTSLDNSSPKLILIQLNSQRADRALNLQVPRIESELDDSMEALAKLGAELPVIRSQVQNISDVYLSGHKTVRAAMLIVSSRQSKLLHHHLQLLLGPNFQQCSGFQ